MVFLGFVDGIRPQQENDMDEGDETNGKENTEYVVEILAFSQVNRH